MPLPFYTEIRISHKCKEEKIEYESILDEVLKANGYTNRTEFVRDKIREMIKEDTKHKKIMEHWGFEEVKK